MSKNILIVEDELDIRESLQELFESEGYDVHTATNGAHALELLKTAKIPPPKLILLDLLMPVMNGIEFRQAQATTEGIKDIPVVVMSADNYAAKKASELSVRYLKKPLELYDLLQMVETHRLQ